MNLFEPLHFDFMRDALLVGSVIAAMCAMLSCFLILKGWSLMGDAISHAVLPGIVLAYIAGLPLALGAFASGLLCAVSTGFIKQNSRIKEDTVMGVVFTGLFAFGLVIFSKTPSDLHLDHILFGNILGITKEQRMESFLLGGGIFAVIAVLRRDLLLIVALKAVGIILVVAMLVAPGCIAHLWTDRFDRMLLIAIGSAVASTVAGIFISYHIDGATGACIVLTQALVFAGSLLFAPKYGIFGAARRKNGA